MAEIVPRTEAEKEVLQKNLKLAISTFEGHFPYRELQKVCNAIEALGYEVEFSNNGNVIFTKKDV
jgi:hypothetical protein